MNPPPSGNILYYSKYCNLSKQYVQMLSKMALPDLHYVCVDRRVQDPATKTMYAILDDGARFVIPVTEVPALVTQHYQILFGSQILEYLRPKQQQQVKLATQHNMEPMAFSFGGGNSGSIVSDQYSFLDQDPADLNATGNGGMRQMHNYMDLDTAFSGKVSAVPTNDSFHSAGHDEKRVGEDVANLQMEAKLKQLQEQRAADLYSITGNRPPVL